MGRGQRMYEELIEARRLISRGMDSHDKRCGESARFWEEVINRIAGDECGMTDATRDKLLGDIVDIVGETYGEHDGSMAAQVVTELLGKKESSECDKCSCGGGESCDEVLSRENPFAGWIWVDGRWEKDGARVWVRWSCGERIKDQWYSERGITDKPNGPFDTPQEAIAAVGGGE